MNRLTKNSLSKTECSGFTMLEVMIVIGLLGLILLIGFPNFQSMRLDQTLNAEATKIKADLRYMQQIAFDTQNTCRMTYGAGSYSIKLDSAVDPLKAEKLDNNVKFQNAVNDSIAFGGNGLPTGGAFPKTINIVKNSVTIQIIINSGGKIDIL